MAEKTIKNTFYRKDRKKAKTKELIFILCIVGYQIINFCIFWLGLNVNSILLTFQSIDSKTYEVTWVGLQNYIDFFKTFASAGNDYWNALKGSFLHYLTSFITFPLGILMAFYVYKKSFGTKAFRCIVMLPNILSGMLTGLMFKRFVYALPMLMKSLGFENFPALMIDPEWTFFTTIYYGIWSGFAGAVIYYGNAMIGINDEIVESAQLDGISYWKELIYIDFPMIMPTIATFQITNFAGILTEQGPLYLFWSYNAPRETYRWGYLIFQTTMKKGQGQYPVVATIGLISTLIWFPLTMLVRKLFDKLDPMAD